MPSQYRTPAQRQNLMRKSIASLAARIMAEDGIADYGFAKRKAARQLGAPETEFLPTNAEIETELRVYQALYQGQEHHARLLQLRTIALQVMRLLESFNPYLTGPVLDGTAGRFADIEIELFPDSAKEVEIFLLNRGIPLEQIEPRRGGSAAPEALLRIEQDDARVVLSIYPPALERRLRRGAHNSKAQERVRAGTLELLLQEMHGDAPPS